MKKEPVSKVHHKRMVLHKATESIKKELASAEKIVKKASEELRKHDPDRHTQSSGAKKRMRLNTACERRDELEYQLTAANEMMAELDA